MSNPKEKKERGELKYCLIAQQKDTDYYVVATENGELKACSGDMAEQYRIAERLITFDTLIVNILTQHYDLESGGLIPEGSASERSAEKISHLLKDAIIFLGAPTNEDVIFFSIPDSIAKSLQWHWRT